MSMMSSGHWNPDGGNVITRSALEHIFARQYAVGASMNAFLIDSFDRVFAHFQKLGKIMVVND